MRAQRGCSTGSRNGRAPPPPSPCRFAQVGGAFTYALGLRDTEDYLDRIRSTRDKCDYSGAIEPVRSGGAYDLPVGPLHCFMDGSRSSSARQHEG